MAAHDVDFFVIGGGSGGVRAARIAAGHGARVMLAEEYRLGGTCVIRGCVPKKLMVMASRFSDDFADARGFGWTVGDMTFDWPSLIRAKDTEIARLEAAYGNTLDKAGVQVEKTRAVIRDAHTVELADGRSVSARHILVATGGAPSKDPVIPGGELGITSNEVFHLKEQPRRVLVVGGGYIAVEFAGIFRGLGSEVSLLHRGDAVLRGFDSMLREALTKAYVRKGIELYMNNTVQRIDRTADGRALHVSLAQGAALEVDCVLVATGRRPNTSGLGLERAGVKLGQRGEIAVDPHSATNVASIHAVGDVTDRVQLTPVAIREGHVLADHLFANGRNVVDHSIIASTVFSTPEVGSVGLTEDAARAKGAVRVFKSDFRPMKATLSGREDRTYMKLVVEAATDKVLGAHMIGADAGEMIQLLGVALTMGATKADLDRTMAVHPTAAEEWVTMR